MIVPDYQTVVVGAFGPVPPAVAAVVNIFCPTGKGGGINPTCKAGADRGVGPGAGAVGGPAPGSRATYEAGGFVFKPVAGEWKDRLDPDDTVMVFHPSHKRGKEPYLTGATEDNVLKAMARSERTQTLMQPKAARPSTATASGNRPARADVSHGSEVRRSVLVGDRIIPLTGTVEVSKSGEVYVRTKAVNMPVWAGGSIPSKRIKITDDWLPAAQYDAQRGDV